MGTTLFFTNRVCCNCTVAIRTTMCHLIHQGLTKGGLGCSCFSDPCVDQGIQKRVQWWSWLDYINWRHTREFMWSFNRQMSTKVWAQCEQVGVPLAALLSGLQESSKSKGILWYVRVYLLRSPPYRNAWWLSGYSRSELFGYAGIVARKSGWSDCMASIERTVQRWRKNPWIDFIASASNP